MDGSIKPQAEPAADAKQKPSWLIRAGRGRTGGSTGLDLALQRARHQGRRVKPLDGDLRSKTLSTLYPAQDEKGRPIRDEYSSPATDELPDIKEWLGTARIGRFKPICDFDWAWPKRCDRAAIEALMTLEFLDEASNVVLVGPNGVGKSMLAQNIAHQALIRGHTVLFTSAGQLLGDLCALDSDSALRRRLRHYARPQLLVIDEVGYLSYSNRHADLMFELISRRYLNKSTMITTNRPFAEWREVFPNAACVVSLVDRLPHNAEIVSIDGESYRLKEAHERTEQRARQRRGTTMSKPSRTLQTPVAPTAVTGPASEDPQP